MKALLFERQWIHLFSLAVLGAVVAYSSTLPGYRDGELFGISTHAWLWVAVSCSVLHQVYVWFTWRAELHLTLLSRLLGSRAFAAYSAGFLLLLVLRFASIVLVAAANRGSWRIHPLVGWGSVLLVLLPAGYTLYSIQKYFSFARVLGIDHFDPAFRSLGLVRRGIFKYTANAMYTFLALAFLIPGLSCASKTGLLGGIFSYASLWVHYFTVELPDMKTIYPLEKK